MQLADFDGDGDEDVAYVLDDRATYPEPDGKNRVRLIFNRDGTLFPDDPANQKRADWGVPPRPTDLITADLDGDGDLDLVSISPDSRTFSVMLNRCVTTCEADVNGDGMVDAGDLLDLLGAWGPCPAPCPEDLFATGIVDAADLLALLANWGPC